MRFFKFLLIISISVCFTFINNFEVKAQSEANRLAFGFNFGGVKYWGEFTDNQFWLGGDLFFRYNITSDISLMAVGGLAQARYKTGNDIIALYPDYFGDSKRVGDFYKNTNIKINDKNQTRLNTYELYLSYNFFPHERFVPYLFVGAGMLNWEPRSGDTGYDGALPNNADKKYDKTKFVFPVGFGFETYLTDNLVLNGRGTLRITGTDYLDDYKIDGSENDIFLTFGLGVSYYILGDADYDKDGLTNDREKAIGTDPKNPDTDGDGLKDGEEVDTYKTNPLKQDTDDDGLNDFDEITKHKTNPIQADTDFDGLKDGEEITRKTDPLVPDTDNDSLLDGDEVIKYQTDPLKADTDEDGLSDGLEITQYNTNPKAKDTDNDLLSDGDEVNKYKTNPSVDDTDSDGLKDGEEVNQYKTDPLKPDTDGDSLNDGSEVKQYKTDPLKPDTDSDGLSDGDEVNKYKTNPLLSDSDNDGLKDGDELNNYKTDPLKADTDGDGLKDGDEVLTYKTDPLKADTDGDVLNDGDEINKYKTNPLLSDTDNDKLSDGAEVNTTKTDPLNPDTDGDNVIDGEDDCPLVAGEKSDLKGKNGCPQPPKIGTKTDFPDILFIVNSDNFNFEISATVTSLAKVLAYVNQCDGLQVIIEGHASEEGNAKRNQELSELRAKKVKEWLIEQGVKPEKFSGTLGFGSSQPKIAEPKGKALKNISKTELENIRKQNRRITIKVTKTCD
ncbi:MAG TPA: OmpA family protein [Candidatus Kapabacteria bacterium]|nr:OmpA family protein [Candidatus Kapabacteria bacterium]